MNRSPNSRGFSLIEIVLVLAVSGALFLIVFVGQRQLRARATFDASVEKLVSTLNDTHNQASAGINIDGPADGSVNCGGGATTAKYEFAGITWAANDSPGGATFSRVYHAADRTGITSCVFRTDALDMGDKLRLDGVSRQLVGFAKTASAGTIMCSTTASIVSFNNTYATGACGPPTAAGPLTITVTSDHTAGFIAHIDVGANGLVSRAD